MKSIYKCKCKYCKKEFDSNSWKNNYCSDEHKKMFLNHKKFPDGTEYVECKLCGKRATELYIHLKKVHQNITIDEYLKKFNLKRYDLETKSNHERKSKNATTANKLGLYGFTSENNPSYSKECKAGRNSPFSMNFKGYDSLSIEEKEKKITELSKVARKTQNERGNNPTKIDYYIKRGYSINEAKKLLKEHQTTFTLKKCIEKYGEKEGKKKWKDRQEKWQKSLNNLPDKEIERIYKAKLCDNRGWSKISQELFKEVHKRLNGKYEKVFYATVNPKIENSEYMIIDRKTNKKYLLDFYVKETNKAIEFDGDYWHGSQGNKKRDEIRDKNLKKLGFNIFRVKECDYRQDSEKIINECLNFLNS